MEIDMTDPPIFILYPYIRIEYHNKGYYKVYNLMLDMQYVVSQKLFQLMQFCSTGKTLEQVRSRFPADIIKEALDKKLIVTTTYLYEAVHLKYVEIEINSGCNYQCQFCPNSGIKHFENKIMPLNTFQSVIDQIQQISSIKHVTVNFYNEPTIDPYFIQRVDMIRKAQLHLTLYTNGSCLTEDKLTALANLGQYLNKIEINLPSLDMEEYKKITGNINLQGVLENIQQAYTMHLPVGIIVNGHLKKQFQWTKKIKAALKGSIQSAVPSCLNDRAGNVKNEYAQNIAIKDAYLAGCHILKNSVIVLWDGSVTICCNDYNRENIIGNIQKENLADIVHSEKYKDICNQVQGLVEADKSFICRKCYYAKCALDIKKDLLDFLNKQ